jgi:uncharacterized protein YqjF (DUF2071 family)
MSLSPLPTEEIQHPFAVQGWDDLTSIHWSYPPSAVAKLLPPGLELDLYDGKAWVGLLPFLVKDFHPPWFPPVPWISTFLETNCRTYVRAADGSAGVWFFSLDADRLLDVLGARIGFSLPYIWSAMRKSATGAQRFYEHTRKWPGKPDAHCRVKIEIGEPIPPSQVSDLDIFLSARWRLYTVKHGAMYYAQVCHQVWPFHRATLVELDQTVLAAAGLPKPEGDPIVLYSPGVQARVTWTRKLPE